SARPQCRWPTCAGRWTTPACRPRSAAPCSPTGAPTGGVHASQPVAVGRPGATLPGTWSSTCDGPDAHASATPHRSGHTVATYPQCNTYEPATRADDAARPGRTVRNQQQPIATRAYQQVTGDFFPPPRPTG